MAHAALTGFDGECVDVRRSGTESPKPQLHGRLGPVESVAACHRDRTRRWRRREKERPCRFGPLQVAMRHNQVQKPHAYFELVLNANGDPRGLAFDSLIQLPIEKQGSNQRADPSGQ